MGLQGNFYSNPRYFMRHAEYRYSGIAAKMTFEPPVDDFDSVAVIRLLFVKDTRVILDLHKHPAVGPKRLDPGYPLPHRMGNPVLEGILDEGLQALIAQRGRGTPRLALRLLQACHRVSRAEGEKAIVPHHFRMACALEQLDDLGLGSTEQAYLKALAEGTSRLNVFASMLGLPARTVSCVVEPFLLRAGLMVKDDRGRHVTAAATVHDLPGGGLLVDTPGVRELALEMDENELPWYFPEFAALAPACKFRDCSHTHEPDCAVRAAAEALVRKEGPMILLRTCKCHFRTTDQVLAACDSSRAALGPEGQAISRAAMAEKEAAEKGASKV